MSLDPAFVQHVKTLFSPLAQKPGATPFPEILSLAHRLESHLAKATSAGGTSVNLPPDDSSLFATAAVEMWQRAVHSYLISASLTGVSPIWASVSGYYSSHYSVRAFAHLHGYFQLFEKKKIARVATVGNRQVCQFDRKLASEREHKAYWKLVKESDSFKKDALFGINPSNTEPSDVAHRDRANYADHVGQFPMFRPLDRKALEDRLDHIAQIPCVEPPIPRRDRFPQVEAVQILAYQRLIRFRSVLDEILVKSNRYWTGKRTPTWADILSFQIAAAVTPASLLPDYP